MIAMNMKRIAVVVAGLTVLTGCNDLTVPNLNSPSVEDLTGNPTVNSIVAAAQGMMATSRGNTSGRVMFFGVYGRETYDLRPEEPRTTTDRLIGPVDPVNGGGFWGGEYTDIQNGLILLDALDAVDDMPDADKEAVRGFTKTVMAESFWNIIMAHTTFGAALDPPADPGEDLSPIVSEGDVYNRIYALLNEAAGHLGTAGGSFPFSLTEAYAGFDTPAAFIPVVRALEARMRKYRGDFTGALTALGGSFINPAGAMDLGVMHSYSTNPGDASSPFFSVASHWAHPRFLADAQLKGGGGPDDRTAKVTDQGTTFSLLGIDVTHKYNIYDSQSAPLPWITNEELILIRAEAKLATGDRPGAVADLNLVRQGVGGLDAFVDPGSDTPVLDEILYNRFMSLTLRGGYTYFDARQYGRLDLLPRAVSTHVVFPQLPFPQNECLARTELGTGDNEPCGTIRGS
jgi:hypothetical protein